MPCRRTEIAKMPIFLSGPSRESVNREIQQQDGDDNGRHLAPDKVRDRSLLSRRDRGPMKRIKEERASRSHRKRGREIEEYKERFISKGFFLGGSDGGKFGVQNGIHGAGHAKRIRREIGNWWVVGIWSGKIGAHHVIV